MENILFTLKSISACWLSSSPTCWTSKTTFAFLCGLWLLLLLLPYFQTGPSSSPPRRRHRTSRKQQAELRRRSTRDKKKSEIVRACRDCLQELDGVRDLVSLLQSHLGRRSDQGGLPQPLGQEGPGDTCNAAPAGAQQPCGEPVMDAVPATSPSPAPRASTLSPSPRTSSVSIHLNSSPSASWPPESLLPSDGFSPQLLAASPSLPRLQAPEASPPRLTASPAPPRPDSALALPSCMSLARQLEAIPRSSSPRTPWLASPVPAILGLGPPSCPIPALSSWREANDTWSLSTSTPLESRQRPLCHRHPEAPFCGDPTNRAGEAGVLSSIDPDVQKLLEILITKRAALGIWKEKAKEGSDSHLHSLGSVFTSGGGEQDPMGCRPFWGVKGQPQQLLGPEKPPYPDVSGDSLQPKRSQLFWGLPTLHSESLVATVSLTGSPLELPSVVFNESSPAVPFQIHLSLARPFPHTLAETPALTLSLSQSQPLPPAQVEPQAHLAPSVPRVWPSLPPQMAGEAPDPPVQNGAPSFIPNAMQNLECHFWKKQLERNRTLPSVVKPSQEVFSQVLPGFPQDSQAPQAPRSVSVLPVPSGDLIRPELQEHLEQQLWKRSMKQQDQGPHKIQHPVELTQPHGELRKVPRAQSAQKTRSRHPARTRPGKSLGKATRPSVGRGWKDLRKSLSSSLLKVSGINSEGSDSMKPPTSGPDQRHPEKLLRVHLGRKSGQIRQGQIPVGVHQSRLAVTHAPDLPGKPSAHRETGNLTFSKPPKPCVNIFHDFSILSPYTQRMLEAHIVRFRVRHRWGLPLKVLKPLRLFKLKKSSIFTPPSTPSSATATCPSKARARAKFSENPSQPQQAETVITEESGLTLGAPLLAPQPACEEIQQSPGKSSPGDGRGPSGAPPAGQGAGPRTQTPPYSFVGRTWHGETGGGALENHISEASPSPAMAADEPMRESGGWASRDPCSSATVLELNLESQSSRAKEAREVGEAEEAPAWGDTLEPSVLASNQPIHVDVRRSGSSGSSQGPSPPTVLVSRGQEEPDAQPEEAELQGLVGPKRAGGRAGSVLLQDCETGVLLQDCASSKLLQDCPSDVFLAADVLASHRSLSGFQSDSSTDTSTSQMTHHFTERVQSSEGRPEPQRRQGLGKTQGEASVCPKGREDPERFSPGGRDKWLAELKAFHAKVMTCPLRDQESAETLRSKLRQLLLKKENAPQESHLRRRMRHFLQWIFPSKGKRLEDSPHQGEPAPATPQSPGSSSGRSVEDSKCAETQALLRAVRHILKEKLVPHQGLRASEFNRCKRERQAPAGPSVCFQRILSYQEQRRVMSGTASIPRATLKGHSCPNKTQWIRGRDSRWAFVPRMLGSPDRPCHHEWMVVRASGRPHHPYCPRHCLLHKYVSPGHSVCASHSFLGRTPFLQERMHTVQTKTYFSHVSTSSVG